MSNNENHTDPAVQEKANQPKDIHKPFDGANASGMKITIAENGPYIVSGNVPLAEDAICESADGSHLEYHHVQAFDGQETYALCRCGESVDKPFCDSAHVNAGYNDGSEAFEPGWAGKRDDRFKDMPDAI